MQIHPLLYNSLSRPIFAHSTAPSMSWFELITALFCVVCAWTLSVEASVHEYAGEKFVSKGNAYVVHGGSEGIYNSLPNQNDSSISANGDAYIR